MDYKAVSQQVVDNVGGLENIEGATHCVTRLRLVLKDTSKYNKAELENIDGVKGVLYNSGQLMIIFGTGTVNKVYDEFMALTGVKEISASEVKGAEADKKGKFFSVLKVFSDIFIPIIPAFVGAAIIIGLKSLIVANGLFGMEGSLADHSEFLKNLASFFAIIATTFDYLPVLVMYSAVKRFGGNPILGILVGIVMVHPSLMNRNTFVMDPTGAEYWNFGPLSIPMVAFQGGVFPAILTAWFMAKVEKIAQKYIPEVVSFVFVPTVTLILANVALFTVFGPLGNLIGDVLAGVIDILYNRWASLVPLSSPRSCSRSSLPVRISSSRVSRQTLLPRLASTTSRPSGRFPSSPRAAAPSVCTSFTRSTPKSATSACRPLSRRWSESPSPLSLLQTCAIRSFRSSAHASVQAAAVPSSSSLRCALSVRV